MRIAFLSSANNPLVISKINYFLENGHEVYYFSLPSRGKSKIPEGVKSIPLNPIYILRNIQFFRWGLSFVRLWNITKVQRIDILQIMGLGAIMFAPFSRSKNVVLSHMGSDTILGPQSNAFIKLMMYKFCYRYINAVTQDSNIAQEGGYRLGAPVDNNLVIEIGVNFKYFHLDIEYGIMRKKLGIGMNKKIVFSSRNIEPLYNIDKIIETILIVKSKIKDVIYLITTYGHDYQMYVELAEKLGVSEDIIFLDYLDQNKDLPFYNRDADVVVSIPSSDSSPGSVYQAMACGTPVIVSELPWYKGKFKRDHDFITVPVNDVNKLAFNIIKVLSGKKKLNILEAYNKVYEKVDWYKENRKLEKLYVSLL